MVAPTQIENAVQQEIEIAEQELEALRSLMRSFRSVIVAYSGGVDSALVMAVAHECLGERAIACTGVSPSYPQRELMAAITLAERLGAPHRIIETHEHLDPRYAANPRNRCYFCKSDLYRCLTSLAQEENAEVIVDGTNASDLQEHRPGYAAAVERGVRSPLAELGISKSMVRAMARRLNLTVWDKPASPCLASRVPTGVVIVPQLLSRIEQAEDVLAKLGFTEFRVRHHGEVARLELPLEALPKALEHREAIVKGIRAAGYKFVSVDLAGFRSGSLNA